MIANSCYIRQLSALEKDLLCQVQDLCGLSTTPALLRYCLKAFLEQRRDVQRLERIIAYKQRKLEALQDRMGLLNAGVDASL